MVITCHMHVYVQMHMCLCLYTCRYGLLLWTCCWPDKHGTCMYMYMYMYLGLVIVCMHARICSLLTEGILLSFFCVQLCVPTCMWPGTQPSQLTITVIVCLLGYECLCLRLTRALCTFIFVSPQLAPLCIQ